MIIDAWGQHPTLRHSQDPIFDSLRRWTKSAAPTEQLPVAATVDMMDRGGVDRMLISAWVAPRNVMISNEEVAEFVGEAPDRLIGVGSVDISRPMEAVAEIRRCVRDYGFKAIRVLPWLWGIAADGPALLSRLRGLRGRSHSFLHADRTYGPLDAVGSGPSHLFGSGRLGVSRSCHRRRTYRLSVDGRSGCRRDQASKCVYRYVSLHSQTISA